jgi:hypothetical protein
MITNKPMLRPISRPGIRSTARTGTGSTFQRRSIRIFMQKQVSNFHAADFWGAASR